MYLKLLKTIVAISTTLIISGCASLSPFSWFDEEDKPPVVEFRTVEVKTPITHPQLPRAIQLNPPEYFVVSEANLEQFLEEMTLRNGGNLVFIAHTIDDYELMSENVQEIKRYINQLKQVVIYYRNLDKPEEAENEQQSQ